MADEHTDKLIVNIVTIRTLSDHRKVSLVVYNTSKGTKGEIRASCGALMRVDAARETVKGGRWHYCCWQYLVADQIIN
jgi:hypothetical protein